MIIISVWKKALQRHEGLGDTLTRLSVRVREQKQFCEYFPKGDYRDLVHELQKMKVPFGIHSDERLMLD
jgi:hypothetical protein